MKIQKIARLGYAGQDGVLWGDLLFRFVEKGNCRVFDAHGLDTEEESLLPLLTEFKIDPSDGVVPHFNAVVFGCERWTEEDEFPLLYANVYNNYAKAENRREGVCCVYRLMRRGDSFATTLVQVIRIGFTDDPLWRSVHVADVRPYGNFVIDREKKRLHVFTMRDEEKCTRYFTFSLPAKNEGVLSSEYGVPTVDLGKEDVLSYFDTEYHRFIQGACCHRGRIYSTEGFNANIHPALRVIDPERKCQLCHMDLTEYGYDAEAEWIDFRGERCIYSDGVGDVFAVDFDL